MLRALLVEIAATPGFVAGGANPLAEAYELVLDEATAMERVPTEAEYKQFRKATAAVSAQQAGPASRGPASSRMLDLAAGKYPEAYVVVVKGPGAGARHRLREECSIGRSASAEIPIVSDSISRRHATIYALEGEFWLTDLGSTNTTEVDGKRLTAKPAKLAPGAIIRVGDVELRYEEGSPTKSSEPSG
jgi:Ca-activated chloride channel family protein